MRSLRLVAVVAATIATALAPAAAAQADTAVPQRFHADSGDACRYGATEGTLTWRLASPTVAVAVGVKGRLADRPLPNDPGSVCRDDGYYSIATFVAYAGNAEVGRQARRANNDVVGFDFTLGSNSTIARIDRVVIQVCRSPLNTLPPSYCGRAVEYRPSFGA